MQESMADPYYRYDTHAASVTIDMSNFPGNMTSEASLLQSQRPLGSTDYSGASAFLHRERTPMRPAAFGLDDTAGVGVHPERGMVGITAVASSKVYSQTLGISPTIPDVIGGVPGSVSSNVGESNLLFVGGLPTDCTRREVSHLFRPFAGYREIRVIHKEPRRNGDRAMVLCFVEFADAKCARTAMDALEGYKFDDKKPDSPALQIQFAHFPFRPPSNGDEKSTPR